jgi:hypothetical protein
MKTTVEVSDDLYRRAKSEAALGLRLVLDTPRQGRQPRLAVLMKRARGTVDSGITDLASNSEHLNSFGREVSRHR